MSHTSTRVDSLITRLDKLSLEMFEVSQKLNSGNGTAAQLVNDRALYDDTRTAMRELTALVKDLRTNPKKYFKVSVF